jgi:tetratricopeptide (TPR) repeat protein
MQKYFAIGILCFSSVCYGLECDALDEEFRKSQQNLSDSVRLLEIQVIHNDMLDLRHIPDHHMAKPKSYWQNCLDSKVRSLNMHVSLASPKLKSNGDFHVLLSSGFEMRGDVGRAYFHAVEASKIFTRDHALRLRALSLWLKSQETMLGLEKRVSGRSASRKALALGDKKDFDQKIDFFLLPVMRDRNASSKDKIAAHQVRAAYYESLARIVDAAGDWETLTKIDPRNVVSHKKLAAFELSRGRKTEAQRVLEHVIKIMPSDLGAQKKLIEIYVDKREMQRARSVLRQALAYYPDDSDLLSFQKIIN